MNNKYRLHEFAQIIGRSTSTLRRWDKEDRLVAKRTISNQYTMIQMFAKFYN
ncbi:MAG: hypothetical protein DRR08_14535 [Candidatus Parabeggiatoa sp. nov. 2]|nr:MAG: hypothetical protein DRR08_14535 [Gammaproteobacteria bacterium]